MREYRLCATGELWGPSVRSRAIPIALRRGSEEHDAYYLASASLLPKSAMIAAVKRKLTSDEIAQKFGTSSELVEYRIKRLGLWWEHTGKQIRLSPA